jgi:branched-chain amino acid transport system substrate-binding protein
MTVLVGGMQNTVQPLLVDTTKYDVYSLQWAFPWFLDTPALSTYHAAINQYGGGAAGPTSAETWMELTVAQYALSKVGANPNSAAFLSALHTINNQSIGGVTPPLNYAQGQKAIEVRCFYEVKMSAGQLSAPSGMTPVCAN